MPETVTYIDQMDIDDIRHGILQRIGERASELGNTISNASNFLDRIEAEKVAYEIAFLEAARTIQQNISSIVEEIVLRSCVETVEYDYEPYVTRLLTAVRLNLDKIITYIPDKSSQTVYVEVTFDPLGTPEEWMDAVEKTRELLEVGTYGDPPNMDADLRSWMWKEKIYGVDREGKTVMRRRKKGDSYDVTDRFIGKYYNTIITRLSFIPRDKAPYWYFINYGSVSIGEGEGTPYPRIEPTGMMYVLREYIQELFRDALYNFTFEAEKALGELIFPEEDIEDVDYVDDWLEDRDYSALLQEENLSLPDENETVPQVIDNVHKAYTTFIRSGKVVTMEVDPITKRFIRKAF